MTGERNVLGHEQEVSHGQTAQDPVDVVAPQFLLTENDDVEDVDDHTDQSDDQTEASVSQLERTANPLDGNAAVVLLTGADFRPQQARDVQVVIHVIIADVGRIEVLLHLQLVAQRGAHCLTLNQSATDYLKGVH